MFERRSDLKKFLAVAETGTVLGAADRIAITQPALSRTIARLEATLGGKLFERLPTGVRLTEFGATVADQARHILREIETAEGRVRSALSGYASGLRVSAGPTWMQAVMPEVAARFHKAFPDIELRLYAKTFLEGIRLLVNGESDLHCGRIDAERHLPAILRRESFLSMTSSIAARSDHPLHAGRVTCDDLVEWPWIDCEAPARTRDDEEQSPLVELLDELFARTGKRVRTVVRAGPAGLALMGTGPYLSRLPVDFLDRLPGLRLKPLPIDFGTSRFSRRHRFARFGLGLFRFPALRRHRSRGRPRTTRGIAVRFHRVACNDAGAHSPGSGSADREISARRRRCCLPAKQPRRGCRYRKTYDEEGAGGEIGGRRHEDTRDDGESAAREGAPMDVALAGARGQSRKDEACEHQIDADQLHRRRDDKGEQHEEAGAGAQTRRSEPENGEEAVYRQESRNVVPGCKQDLAGKHMAQRLAAMGIVGKSQQGHGGGNDEAAPDHRFLLVRRLALDPAEEQRDGDAGRESRPLLHNPGGFLQPEVEQDDGKPDDLGGRQVDKHDPALEDLDSQRRVRRRDDQPDDKARRQDIEQVKIDL